MSDAEYRALREGAALIRSSQRVVWARGADATTFLHDLLSADVAGLESGETAQSLLLAPNGRLTAVMVVARIGPDTALVTDQPEPVTTTLARFRIRVDVELETDDRPVWMLVGPNGTSLLKTAGWAQTITAFDDAVLGIPHPAYSAMWYLAGEANHLDQLAATPASPAVWETLRIELAEPRFGVDVDATTIPNEAFGLRAFVDFDKGCYLGQELVERIDARGRLVKSLAGVRMEGGDVPPAGAEVFAGGDRLGVLTSTTHSPAVGGPIGIGLLRAGPAVGDAVTVRWESSEREGTLAAVPFLTDF